MGRRVLTAAAAAAAEPGGRRESARLVPALGVEAVADGRPGMAFMEKPPAGKVLLDDTVPLTAAIEASQSLQSHTVRGPPVGRAARGGPGRREGFGRPGAGWAGSPGRGAGPGVGGPGREGSAVAVALGQGPRGPGELRSAGAGGGDLSPLGQAGGGARWCGSEL